MNKKVFVFLLLTTFALPSFKTINAASELSLNSVRVTSKDHILGSKNANIKLVSYTDIQCPYCQQFQEEVKYVIKEQKLDISYIFRHFPLSQIHPRAQRYAQAAECAEKLTKKSVFYPYVDSIMKLLQTTLYEGVADERLTKIAVSHGISAKKFNQCLNDTKIQSLILKQGDDAMKVGAQGTPYNIFVLKKSISNSQLNLLNELLGDSSFFTVSSDKKHVVIPGGIQRNQLADLVNILKSK